MRYLLILLFLLTPFLSRAQVMDDSALRSLSQGEVSFLEGEFVAYLTDTTSLAFVESQINALGYQISSSNIQPLQITLVNKPDEEVLKAFEAEPQVRSLQKIEPPITEAAFMDSLKQLGLLEEELMDKRIDFLRSLPLGSYLVTFTYDVNESALKALMSDYRSMAYQITRNAPRSVNVKTEIGSEQEVMKVVEALPFVDYTALIGILNE